MGSLILVVLVGVAVVAGFRDRILLAVAPKMVLSCALSNTLEQLKERFQESPVMLVAKSWDPEGNYTVDAAFTQTVARTGEIGYRLQIQTDGEGHGVQAEGTATTADQSLQFSGFANRVFLAVSSEELTGNGYYGITYDTFAEDVRKIPFLGMLISDKTLSEWDEAVQKVKTQMMQEDLLPKMPGFSGAELSKLLLGLVAMPCQRETRGLEGMTCQVLTYTIPEDQAQQLLSTLTGKTDTQGGTITVCFYLNDSTLVQISAGLTWEDEKVQGRLYLGSAPDSGAIRLEYSTDAGNVCQMDVSTDREEDRYEETWVVKRQTDGRTEERSLHFRWNLENGTLTLQDGLGGSATLVLAETEQGFLAKTEDPASVYTLLTQQAWMGGDMSACVLKVQKGARVVLPAYRNIDQWSVEDLLAMAQRIAALLGKSFLS